MRIRIILFVHVVNLMVMRKASLFLILRICKYTSITSLLHYLYAAFPRSNIETLFSEYV